MGKLYLITKYLSKAYDDDIMVVTSKKKAEKLALIHSTENETCRIREIDTKEYESQLKVWSDEELLVEKSWNIRVYFDGKTEVSNGPYLTYKNIEKDDGYFGPYIIVRHIKAETEKEAINIAKKEVLEALKHRKSVWTSFIEKMEGSLNDD